MQGVLDNDEALMAGLIIMDPLGPTKDRNFHRDMAQEGDLEVDGVKYSPNADTDGGRDTGGEEDKG